MYRTKIAVATAAFRQDIRKSLHSAAESGAEGVQFELRNEIRIADYGETARRQLLYYLKERDLQLASTHFALRSPLLSPDSLDQRIDALKKAIEFTALLKVRCLTFRTGPLPATDSKQYSDQLLPILSELAALGNHTGVVPTIIPSGDSPETFHHLTSSTITGPIGIEADLGGWVMHGQSVNTMLRELHSVIQHVQVRDAIQGIDGLGKEVPVGRGEIDWDEIAALLDEMNYTNWLTINRTAGDDRSEDITNAVTYLRNLFPSV